MNLNWPMLLLKTSNAEGTNFVTMPYIGTSSMPQVRSRLLEVSVVNHAITFNSRIVLNVTVQIALSILSYNYLTVDCTIILSNVCDYVYNNELFVKRLQYYITFCVLYVSISNFLTISLHLCVYCMTTWLLLACTVPFTVTDLL